MNIRKYVAEFLGTLTLVLFACGTAAIVGCTTPAGYATVAVAFGLVIVAMAYSVGNVSGCHINPAVSFAMLLSGRMSKKDFVGYVVAQLLGGIAGAALLLLLLGKDCGFGANVPQPLISCSRKLAFVSEVILTTVFVYVILGVTSKKQYEGVAGVVIGLALTMVHLLGIGLTGTSVNPARSLGPALFAGGKALKDVWIFLLAPMVGGAAAAVIHRLLHKES